MTNWQKLRDQKISLEPFLVREKVIHSLRAWFAQENFHEVDTPLMLTIPTTEAYYDLFETQLKIFGHEPRAAYLAPSPELQMKKLLAAGLENIYQIGKCFRNGEGLGPQHQTEFTMLEYYRQHHPYEKLMTDVEEIFRFLLHRIHPQQAPSNHTFIYQNHRYNLDRPFTRLRVAEVFFNYAGIDEKTLLDQNLLLKKAIAKGYKVAAETTWEEIFNQILLNEIEPHLGQDQPTILYEYPKQQAALARLTPGKPQFADRFELWVAGLEIANAYGELLDAQEQERRCQNEVSINQELGKTHITDYDHDFIAALRDIKEPCSGLALGVDRLAMLFANVTDIRQLTFFPTDEILQSSL